jgi:hypothetical protein
MQAKLKSEKNRLRWQGAKNLAIDGELFSGNLSQFKGVLLP